jgi:hypothetical protein
VGNDKDDRVTSCRYIVKWQKKDGSASGQSESPMSRDTTKAWVSRMNAECPDIEHWVAAIDQVPQEREIRNYWRLWQ